ncbi:hypothetical protein MLD38_000625 [Melastoma candidum]|uniref:Uncharacterized protein n=1 Tax=Melastoma candidum TaxID=119954 RepID=A0ACB9SC98_9MYRT|nr:hypothetical protein MLD38_000625 [Melastoma candidum]
MEGDRFVDDSRRLLEAASEFANYPGVQNDASVREFLDRFPLPVIIGSCALQTTGDVAGLEHTLLNCLERIFRTKYGASLIPDYMPFVVVGLKAASPEARSLCCKIVSCLLEKSDDLSVSPVKLIVDNNVYPLLLDCLINGDERTAAASMDTIKRLTYFQDGVGVVFPADDTVPTHLGNLAARCTSLERVRVLSLIVKLFSISIAVASTIYNHNLLKFFEAEIRDQKDILVTLSVLELLHEMTEVQHGNEILSRTSLLQLLSSIISNEMTESVLRSRAIMICGRLLSKDAVYHDSR